MAGVAASIAIVAAPRERVGAGAPQPMAYATAAGFESGSVFLTAPRSGAPVLIWSQDDGFSRKLVWSRFASGAWSSPRAMTFGIGDDLAPAAGISSTGSVLYWVDDRGRIFFAPFDPEGGNLFAAPRPMSTGGRGIGGPRTEGGGDIPIILEPCSVTNGEPCIPDGPVRNTPPPRLTPDGGNDVPIVLSTGSTPSTNLAVASHIACDTQILSAVEGNGVTVLSVDGAGRAAALAHFRLGPRADRAAAASALSTYYLRASCR